MIRVEVTSEADVTRMVAAFNILPVLLDSDYEIFIGPADNGSLIMRRAWRKDGQRGATDPTDWPPAADGQARQLASEMRWNATPVAVTADGIDIQIVQPPPPSITIMAEDGAELLRLTWPDGRLEVTGDESRWTEAAARFIAGMRKLADA